MRQAQGQIAVRIRRRAALSDTPEKPGSSAVIWRSIGYVVPARAQEPSGETFIRFMASVIRSASRGA